MNSDPKLLTPSDDTVTSLPTADPKPALPDAGPVLPTEISERFLAEYQCQPGDTITGNLELKMSPSGEYEVVSLKAATKNGEPVGEEETSEDAEEAVIGMKLPKKNKPELPDVSAASLDY